MVTFDSPIALHPELTPVTTHQTLSPPVNGDLSPCKW